MVEEVPFNNGSEENRRRFVNYGP
ncbi:unnamed protein product, partial [Rotaria sordida]